MIKNEEEKKDFQTKKFSRPKSTHKDKSLLMSKIYSQFQKSTVKNFPVNFVSQIKYL